MSAGFSALINRFGSAVEVELTSFENPMHNKGVKKEIKKKKRNSRMKKIRKKLSIGARVKQKLHAAGGSGLMGGEVKTVSDVEAVVSIYTDEETGHRYSCDEATGQTQWLSDDDEVGGATVDEEQGEKNQESRRISFRKIVDDDNAVFFQNVETEETVWQLPMNGVVLDEESAVKEKAAATIEKHESHSIVFDASGWPHPSHGVSGGGGGGEHKS